MPSFLEVGGLSQSLTHFKDTPSDVSERKDQTKVRDAIDEMSHKQMRRDVMGQVLGLACRVFQQLCASDGLLERHQATDPLVTKLSPNIHPRR